MHTPSADRIAALRAEISASEEKLVRLREAIEVRRAALNRLLALAALTGASATARRNER